MRNTRFFNFWPLIIFIIYVVSLTTSPGQAQNRTSGKIHYISYHDPVHYVWNKDIPPRLHIRSGDIIIAETRDASDGMQHRHSTLADINKRPAGHPLAGPIYIEEAGPGDVLEVKILNMEIGKWAYTLVRPKGGANPDIAKKPELILWDLMGEYGQFKPGIVIPLQPFLGVMGVAWNEAGEFTTGPPREYGGNLDNKYLTAGSTLYLPVQVAGALFSFGDGHGAQGDGEVGGSAIEAPATATLQIAVRKDKKINGPEYETQEFYGVTGLGTTLDSAFAQCIKHAVDYLVRKHGLTPEEAYMLCSVVVDFKILEAVDKPNYLVGGHIPKRIFGPKR